MATRTPWTLGQYNYAQDPNLIPPDEVDLSPNSAYLRQLASVGPVQPEPLSLPQTPAISPVAKGSGLTQKTTADAESKKNRTSTTYLDKQTMEDMASNLMNIPGMQNYQDNADALQAKYNALVAMPVQTDYAGPLSALSQFLANPSQGYKASPTPNAIDQQEKLLDYGNKLQGEQKDLAKMILQGFGASKSGNVQDQLLQKISAMQQAQDSNQAKNGIAGVRRDKLAIDAGAAFDKDPILKQIRQTNNSLDRATSMIDGKTPVTGKNFALLQNDMINAMAPGGAATEGKVNREMVVTLASQLNDLQTKFGDIKDLRKEQPQIFAQLKGLISQIKDDYNRAGQQSVQEIQTNYQDIEDPNVQTTVKRKADMLNKRFKISEPAATKSAAASTRPAALSKSPSTWTAEDQKAVDDYEKSLTGGH